MPPFKSSVAPWILWIRCMYVRLGLSFITRGALKKNVHETCMGRVWSLALQQGPSIHKASHLLDGILPGCNCYSWTAADHTFTKMLQKGGFLGGILYRLTWMLGKVVLKNSLPRWWCKMLITMVQSRKNNLKKQIHEGLTSQVNHHDCKIYRILWEKPSPNTIWKDHILHGVDWFSPSGANMKGQPLQSLMAIFGQILS